MDKAEHDNQVGLPTDGSINYSSGVVGDGYVHHLYPEYHCPIYYYSFNNGYMFGGRATAGSAGGTEGVEAGQTQLWTRLW